VGNGTVTGPGAAANVLLVTVNGSECDPANSVDYPDKPCVSVKVCDPNNPLSCQTVNDILLDTGSFGLRIFYSALNVGGLVLTPETLTPGGPDLYECLTYGDNTSDWGYVALANVRLGGEQPVSVPIEVIDPPLGPTIPRSCTSPHTGPATGLVPAGYNGVLGVGPLVYDCGSVCVNRPVGQYYTCSSGTCSRTTAPLADQVQNPVASLPADNNGVIVELPGVPAAGLPSVDGFLVLGIGTQPNNTPSGVTVYGMDQNGEFPTSFSDASLTSVADTGTNGFAFPDPSLPTTPEGWFDPSSPVCLSATIMGASGAPSGPVAFQISNAQSLLASSNNVFSTLGAYGSFGFFDWGLPFFLGRTVYVGISGKGGSSLGTGPFLAY
jgi:hypothetical protein